MTERPLVALFLSRLLLNPGSRQVMNEMVHPYEMHRTLMRAFPKATDETKSKARGEYNVLFRVEGGDLHDPVKVYVQSSINPNWSFLRGLTDYLWPLPGKPVYECKDIMPACQAIKNGQVFRFRLRANPTKRIGNVMKGDADLKGKRVGLLREEQQIAWLLRKGLERERGKSGGFEIVMRNVKGDKRPSDMVPCVEAHCENKQKGRMKKNGRSHQTTHLAVSFEGLLRITETDAFRETLMRGIGPGKAFGFGLLSVAPF